MLLTLTFSMRAVEANPCYGSTFRPSPTEHQRDSLRQN